MVHILLINKQCTIQQKNIKKFDETELYKKCNFRKCDGFEKKHCYSYNTFHYSIYGKLKGKANTENKYEMPPPLDNTLFFGTIAIVKYTKDNKVSSLTKEEWKEVYNHFMGGFDDIASDSYDDYESDELENVAKENLTKQGYLKDNFIVDDSTENDTEKYTDETSYNENDSEFYDSELDEEEYISESEEEVNDEK